MEEKIKGEKYFINYYCSNCGRSFRQWFEFGTPASQGTCPHCGVNPRDTHFIEKL